MSKFNFLKKFDFMFRCKSTSKKCYTAQCHCYYYNLCHNCSVIIIITIVSSQHCFTCTEDTVSLVVPRRRGGYIVGLGRRLSLLEWETGTVTDITEVDRETGNRFNDGKCDAKGRLWAGEL